MKVTLSSGTAGQGQESGTPWHSTMSIEVDIPEDATDDEIDALVHPALGLALLVGKSWNRWGQTLLDTGGDVIR